jgi:hypothetical protein
VFLMQRVQIWECNPALGHLRFCFTGHNVHAILLLAKIPVETRERAMISGWIWHVLRVFRKN